MTRFFPDVSLCRYPVERDSGSPDRPSNESGRWQDTRRGGGTRPNLRGLERMDSRRLNEAHLRIQSGACGFRELRGNGKRVSLRFREF